MSNKTNVIASPIGYSNNNLGSYDPSNVSNPKFVIDGSGMSIPFLSGEESFEEYIATAPTTEVTSSNRWLFNTSNLGKSIDFDLGMDMDITQFVIWNYDSSGLGIKDISIQGAAQSDFSDATDWGSFIVTQGEGIPTAASAQVFTLDSSQSARYVRLTISSNHGNSGLAGFGEIAFNTTPIVSDGVIISPVGYSNNNLGSYDPSDVSNPKFVIDGSGMSVPFLSGEENFEDYIASTPTAEVTASNRWLFKKSKLGNSIDFDLGVNMDITQFVIWNYDSSGLGIKDISIQGATQSDFSDATDWGSFIVTQGEGIPTAATAQVFTLDSSQSARYVRLTISSNHGNSGLAGFGEIAFNAILS